VSIKKIWELHINYQGEINDEFLEGINELAQSIAKEPGIIWKIWTHEEGTKHFGSTYLFKDIDSLEKYKAMHIERLKNIGITDTTDYIFDIMEELSLINSAPIS